MNSLLTHTLPVFPCHNDPRELANDFNLFYKEKVDAINAIIPDQPLILQPSDRTGWSEFDLVDAKTLENCINSLSTASAFQDPMPASLFKKLCLRKIDDFLNLVNCCLVRGVFPNCLKEGVIKPLHKSGKDKQFLASYRPVTNLKWLGKLVEKVVQNQLTGHLDTTSKWLPMQSAYRSNNSTETALIWCTNAVLSKVSKKTSVLMISLDLSSAFDTVQHDILINILKNSFQFSGTVANFFDSYLRNRTMKVLIPNALSESIKQETGVPQGSILGPILFLLYLSPLFDKLDELKCVYHFYADDSQFFFEVTDRQLEPTYEEILGEIELCFTSLKLKLNKDKTDIIVFKHTLNRSFSLQVTPFGDPLIEKQRIKILGFLLDTSLSLEDQISSVRKSCFYYLRKLFSCRQFLDKELKTLFVRCYVLSRLDYCNVLYLGLPESKLKKLQNVQNVAPRFVFNQPRFSRTSELMKKLHWLPIKQRIQYKAGCLMHKVKHGKPPTYLKDLFQLNSSSSNPSRRELFQVPAVKTNYEKRAFMNSGCYYWNSLPSYVRNESNYKCFKTMLKTLLFCLAY